MPGFLSRVGDWLRQPGTAETGAPGPVRQEGPLPWAEASAAFAWSLHARLRAPGRNLCVSPFSVHAVLTMAMAGARGATAHEIQAILHHPDDEEVHDTMHGLDSLTRLVLVNAVALKAAWEEPFLPHRTESAPFTREDGTVVRGPMMQGQVVAGYVEQRGLQAVDLAYQGARWSMLVVLPDAGTPLSRLEDTFDAPSLSILAHRATEREVRVFLPRFSLSCRIDNLGASLAAMGMSAAMARDCADFSGMNGLSAPHEDALFISSVIHQATIDVDETGTEATAATAMVMDCVAASRWSRRPPPVPVFRADRPFLFAIRHRANGTILFMGRVADPTATH